MKNSIPFLAGWEQAAGIVRAEAVQLTEEGRDAPWIKKLMDSADLEKADTESLANLWEKLQEAPKDHNYGFVEPSGLEEIHAERPAKRFQPRKPASGDRLYQQMLGAWLGRCCGCALGKPLELFMGSEGGLSSKERIKRYLQAIAPNEYPIRDYIPAHSPAEKETGSVHCPESQRETIRFMESDDDIRYTVIGQKVLLAKGANFTTEDVMRTWLEVLPYAHVCTAETQAYRNYVMRDRIHIAAQEKTDWTWVATHQNPYREWIGAQIRADSFGYAAPGNPELAANFAWRDARMSHIKNGIYGEMFAAAMIAAAFVLDDPREVVQAGLAEIPAKSRLFHDILQTLDICRKHSFKAENFEAVLDEIYAAFGHYHPVHTPNNAALVVAALVLGQRDFEKVITIAVMGGWDTDCNGATAGSIFGAMQGADSIPAKWKDPLHDTLYSQIIDYHPIAISECAQRSVEIAEKIARHL